MAGRQYIQLQPNVTSHAVQAVQQSAGLTVSNDLAVSRACDSTVARSPFVVSRLQTLTQDASVSTSTHDQ